MSKCLRDSSIYYSFCTTRRISCLCECLYSQRSHRQLNNRATLNKLHTLSSFRHATLRSSIGNSFTILRRIGCISPIHQNAAFRSGIGNLFVANTGEKGQTKKKNKSRHQSWYNFHESLIQTNISKLIFSNILTFLPFNNHVNSGTGVAGLEVQFASSTSPTVKLARLNVMCGSCIWLSENTNSTIQPNKSTRLV